jgi:hypothetical protein
MHPKSSPLFNLGVSAYPGLLSEFKFSCRVQQLCSIVKVSMTTMALLLICFVKACFYCVILVLLNGLSHLLGKKSWQ